MIWGPVVVSDNHRVYGKKGMNTPHARATRARADQFTHILQAGSIPRMMGKREIAMKLLSAFAVGLLLAGPLAAQDFDKGRDAFKAGDYATALQELRPLAVQGNAEAQTMLGAMYKYGDGVIKNVVLAHMWYNIANANGNRVASTLRSLIEERMTLEQIGEAQVLALVCLASNYQDCE